MFSRTILSGHGAPFYRDYEWVPPKIKASLDAHALDGRATGSFLEAVLNNDLREAVRRADEVNYIMLGAIVMYCIAELPLASWGTPDQVKYWQDGGGWNGLFPSVKASKVDEIPGRDA